MCTECPTVGLGTGFGADAVVSPRVCRRATAQGPCVRGPGPALLPGAQSWHSLGGAVGAPRVFTRWQGSPLFSSILKFCLFPLIVEINIICNICKFLLLLKSKY